MQRICEARDGDERSSSPRPSSAATPWVGGGSSEHRVAAIRDRERLDPAGLVGGEILLVEPRDGGDRPRDIAFVERAGASLRDAAQRPGEVGQANDLPHTRRGRVLSGTWAPRAQAAAVSGVTAKPFSAASMA